MKSPPGNRAFIRPALSSLTAYAMLCGFAVDCVASLIHHKAPAGGQTMAAAEVSQVLRTDPGFFAGFDVEQLTIAKPVPIFFVGLTDVAAGQFLSAAESRGRWMYLFVHGSNAVGSAELVAEESTGKALRPTGVNKADFSQETLVALRMAEQLSQVKKQDYEVRSLDIPSLLFVAVWLHGQSDDIVIPLPRSFGRWKAYKPYSETRIFKLLQQEAKRKLKRGAEFD